MCKLGIIIKMNIGGIYGVQSPYYSPKHTMSDEDIQKKVEAFLTTLGVPGFIIFGYKKEDDKFQIVSSYSQMPKIAAIKGLSKVLNEFIDREF